jgi:hypothetical protein
MVEFAWKPGDLAAVTGPAVVAPATTGAKPGMGGGMESFNADQDEN